MTKSDDLYPITPEYAVQFGFIISLFAKIELNMQTAAAGILEIDLGTAIILMGDINYNQKRQTLRHLNTTIGIKGYKSNELASLLDDLHKQSKLRNRVAHATWTEGHRPNSIKPMQLILRREEPKPLGYDHNEPDFTVEDLANEVKKLAEIDHRFVTFLNTSGLAARVEAKIEAIKSATASPPG